MPGLTCLRYRRNIQVMKVLRCSDDTYALIADHAGQRRLSLSQAVGELVSERVVGPDYAEEMALPVETVRQVVREELQEALRKDGPFRNWLFEWFNAIIQTQFVTDANVMSICRNLGFEPKTRK